MLEPVRERIVSQLRADYPATLGKYDANEDAKRRLEHDPDMADQRTLAELGTSPFNYEAFHETFPDPGAFSPGTSQ